MPLLGIASAYLTRVFEHGADSGGVSNLEVFVAIATSVGSLVGIGLGLIGINQARKSSVIAASASRSTFRMSSAVEALYVQSAFGLYTVSIGATENVRGSISVRISVSLYSMQVLDVRDSSAAVVRLIPGDHRPPERIQAREEGPGAPVVRTIESSIHLLGRTALKFSIDVSPPGFPWADRYAFTLRISDGVVRLGEADCSLDQVPLTPRRVAL